MNRAAGETLVSFLAMGLGAFVTWTICTIVQVNKDMLWMAVALVTCGIGIAMDQVWERRRGDSL